MSNPPQSAAETVASHSDVVVRRELERQDRGIVGTLELQSLSEAPVQIHVHDEFPAGLPVAEVGFKPGAGPESGDISPKGATIKQPLGDDPVTIQYGISLTGTVEDVQFAAPVVRGVETASDEGVPAPYTDGGEQSFGSAEASTRDDASSSSLSSIIPSFGGKRSDSDDRAQQTPAESTETDGALGAEASNDAIERAVEQVSDGNGNGAETHPSDRDAAASDEPVIESAVFETESTRPDGATATTDSTEQGERPEAAVPQSVELRLDRLSARVEEFATYATALEELIDEHGTGPDIIEQLETDLADIDERVQSVRDELETGQERNATAVDDLRGQFDDEVARLDTALATRDADIEAVGDDIETLDDRVTVVEDDIQSVRETVLEVQAEFATVSDNVEAMREELDALQTEVSNLSEVQESLAEVFGTVGGDGALADD